MNLTVSPSPSLQGKTSLPGDKSISHRCAIFAAMAQGESRIENFLVSGVTRVMLDSLGQLGVQYELQGNILLVHGQGLRGLRTPAGNLYCGNSATTIRLLAGMLAACGVPAVLDGSAGLRARPMNRIIQPLKQMGVPIDSTDGCAPLSIQRPEYPLKALDLTLPVASAQVKTCLLLAAMAADGPTTLHEPGLSRDHTERILRSQGIQVVSQKSGSNGSNVYSTTITPPRMVSFSPLNLSLPGDFSSAAFLIVAALITPDSFLLIKDVGLNPTRTGLLDALLAMGADIKIQKPSTRSGEPVGDLLVTSGKLHGTQVQGEQVVRMIDEFPAFAVAAACAKGVTTVADAAELRVKESDRISGLCREMRKLGISMEEQPDGFTIQGGNPIRGGRIDPLGDHRLAMSLAVAGLAATDEVVIEQAEIIQESFPEFIPTLQSLGGKLSLNGEIGNSHATNADGD
jgi:3-phosphoshikimate 1-carboxyvinyltransferase